MSDQFIRTRLLVGDEPLERLKNAKISRNVLNWPENCAILVHMC